MAVSKVYSSSQSQLAFQIERTAGQHNTSGKARYLRMTGESLTQEISKETSKEINSSRQIASMYLTDVQVSGDINFELSNSEYDWFLEAVCMGSWAGLGAQGGTADNAVFNATAKTVTFTNALATGFGVGYYIAFEGTGISQANKGPHRITAIDAARKVITLSGSTLTNQTVTNCKPFCRRVVNSNVERTFSIEHKLMGSNNRIAFMGMVTDKLSLNFDTQTAVTGTFSFIGQSVQTGTSNLLGDKTAYNGSYPNTIMNTVNGVKDVLIDGKPFSDQLSAGVTKISLEFSNNHKGVTALGALGNIAVIPGTISCTGTMSIYYNDLSLIQDALNQVRHRIEWCVYDSDGHGYAFALPSVEFSSPKVNASQQDEEGIMELEFTALMDSNQQTFQLFSF